MTKEDRLKREAVTACKTRGHNMARFETLSPVSRHYRTYCKQCGAEVEVLVHCAPNEANISGEACAVQCTNAFNR
jgi:hypothetical protein